MTKAPPFLGAGPFHRELPAPVHGSRHTGGVIRFSVQADTRDECVAGLEQLVAFGLVPVMLPAYMSDGRWMARAVARPAGAEPVCGELAVRPRS